MTLEENTAKAAFRDAGEPVRERKTRPDPVPKMIREDGLAPRPAPPQFGFDVDRETFDAKWEAEHALASQARSAPLRNGFNQETDTVSRAETDARQAQAHLDRLRNNGQRLDRTFSFQKKRRSAKEVFDRIDARAHDRNQRGRER